MNAFEKLQMKGKELVDKGKEFAGEVKVAVETKCDKFNLEREIKRQNDVLSKLYAELGTVTYYGVDSDETFRPISDIIRDLNEANQYLATLKEQYDAFMEADDIAIAFDEEPRSEAPEVVYCRHCGKQLPADSAFCSKCGLQLDK